MIYYSGLPYSNSLYHHGILDMHWGIRRWQNPDGSYTAAGKARYAAMRAARATGNAITKTAKAVGKAGKAFGTGIVNRYKRKHPKTMSDEELLAALKRIDMETKYEDAMRERKSKKFIRKTMLAIEDIVSRSAGKFAENAATSFGNKIGERLGESDTDRNYRKSVDDIREKMVTNENDTTQKKNELEDTKAKLEDTKDKISESMNYKTLNKLNKKKDKLEEKKKQLERELKKLNNKKQGYKEAASFLNGNKPNSQQQQQKK